MHGWCFAYFCHCSYLFHLPTTIYFALLFVLRNCQFITLRFMIKFEHCTIHDCLTSSIHWIGYKIFWILFLVLYQWTEIHVPLTQLVCRFFRTCCNQSCFQHVVNLFQLSFIACLIHCITCHVQPNDLSNTSSWLC